MANEQNLRPFVKGDPRINRKGRPKSFDALRQLAQSLANEPAVNKDGIEVVIDDHIATQAEMILRDMMRSNPERFVEIAYGKVKDEVELTGSAKTPLVVKVVYDINEPDNSEPTAPTPGASDDTSTS